MMRRVVLGPVQRHFTLAAPVATTCLRHQQVPPRRPLHVHDSFLTGTSANYFEDLFLQWQENPATVDSTLAQIFQDVAGNAPEKPILQAALRVVSEAAAAADPAAAQAAEGSSIADCERVVAMAKEYARDGHLIATTDPLNFQESFRSPEKQRKETVDLSPARFGFHNLQTPMPVGVVPRLGGIFGDNRAGATTTIKDTVERLRRAYCGNVSTEFIHLYDVEPCSYIRESFEAAGDAQSAIPSSDAMRVPLTAADREHILSVLARATEFEKFLNRKFKGQKRFGVDGLETALVGIHALLDRAAAHGTQEVIAGMAHRGRLNVLCNVGGKPTAELVKEFNKVKEQDVRGFDGQGDVKYHQGWMGDIKTMSGKNLYFWLQHNPSHLECVNPIVQGSARAAQFKRGNNQQQVLPIEIHGDASYAGQGVVFESMGLAGVGLNCTGGTIHIVINNQVGFTTDPASSRSSTHCTDIARVFQIPVVHVNGDAPEDVFRVFNFAADYRRQFGRSIVINLIGYRRYGHNESDDPSATQPVLYRQIRDRPDVLTLYKKDLLDRGLLPEATVTSIHTTIVKDIEASANEADKVDYLAALRRTVPQWKPFLPAERDAFMQKTVVTEAELQPVINALKTLPAGFNLHPTLKDIFARRTATLEKGVGLEWGTAEALALGTLLNDGVHVRLSGQDVERATFSQRHAVVHDQENDTTYTQLQHISSSQAPFHVQNSTLSEFGVLGFEIGYGAYLPNAFVMWEAQFGDFANGAQIIFDQFLSSGESKWGLQSNIVCSFPHGYDGAGPEHSSGRLERFLQSVSEDDNVSSQLSVVERHCRCNMEIVVPTSPKQYFHLLRRHVKRNFRKPLFFFFSKAFLRSPNVSPISELTSGGFEPVLADDSLDAPPSEVRRIVLCCGQVYFALDAARKSAKSNDVAILRIEQLAPFPRAELEAMVDRYPNAVEIVWAQDEPRNMGSWGYIEPRLRNIIAASSKRNLKLRYAGRLTSPSPATGYGAIHSYELAQLCDAAVKADMSSE